MKVELTSSKAIEFLYRAIPYSEQIKDLEINNGNIYFTWRSERYKYEFGIHSIMLSNGNILQGSNSCLLMEKLLKKEIIDSITL